MNAVVKHLSVGRVIFIILAIIIILSLTLPMWFEDIKVIDILATGALILGPVFAILFANVFEDNREKRQREFEDQRERRQRKWEIFRTLLLTRKSRISPEFEAAFNLIEIEFYDEKNVMTAWKKLYDSFNEPLPHKPAEPIKPFPASQAEQDKYIEELAKYHVALAKYKEEVNKYVNKRNDLRANLIAELCKSFFGNLELYEDGYRPQGLADDEAVEDMRCQALTDVLLGNRFIRVCIEPNTPKDDSPKGLGAVRDR